MNLTGTLHKNGVILHEIFDKSENNFTLLPQLPDCVTKPKRRVFLLLTNLIHILEYFRRFCLIFATHAETLLSCLTRYLGIMGALDYTIQLSDVLLHEMHIFILTCDTVFLQS